MASSATPSAPVKGNRLGPASLILGLLALLGAFIPFVNYGSGLLAIIALVIGAVGLGRRDRPKGSAIGGVAASVIALILSIVLALVYAAGFLAIAGSSDANSTTSTAGASKDAAVGTRANPAPLGTKITLSTGGAAQYEVSLGASTLNANSLVADANQFNAAPPVGFEYAMVPVTLTYKGVTSGTPWTDVRVEFETAAGTTLTDSDSIVTGPSPALTDINELSPGASGMGNVVVAIPAADAAEGTWVVSFVAGHKYFFAAK